MTFFAAHKECLFRLYQHLKILDEIYLAKKNEKN